MKLGSNSEKDESKDIFSDWNNRDIDDEDIKGKSTDEGQSEHEMNTTGPRTRNKRRTFDLDWVMHRTIENSNKGCPKIRKS